MSIVQTRGQIMAEYAHAIAVRLADADEALRQAVVAGDTEALLIGMGEREASLTATEDLIGELDVLSLSAAEHASIIRQMVQALERSQVAQAALEAEMFLARREAARAPAIPVSRTRTMERVGYAFAGVQKPLRSTG